MSESEEQPVDLTALADVDAPQTVERAVKRFRRKVVMFVVLPIVGVLLALGGFLYITVRPSLDTPERILRATKEPGALFFKTTEADVDGYAVHILDNAELRPNLGEKILNSVFQRNKPLAVGIHLVVDAPNERTQVSVRPKDWSLENNVFAGSPRVGGWSDADSTISEHWLIVEPRARRSMRFVVETYDPARGASRTIGEFSLETIR